MNVFPTKLGDILFKRKVISAIILTNLSGTLFGFYYYSHLLASTSVKLWPFIPDSPLATLMMAISLILYLRGRQSALIDLLAFIGNIKYGLWTPFVLIHMREGFLYGTSTLMYVFLLISHLLMAVQALMVLEYSDFSLKHVVIVGAWFGLNDIIDYSYGIHAELPGVAGLTSTTALVAYSLTFSSVASLYIVKKSGFLRAELSKYSAQIRKIF